MPIATSNATATDIRRTNLPNTANQVRDGATDAPADISAEEWTRLVQGFMRSDAGKDVVEEIRRLPPAVWASFIGRFGDAPDAGARGAEAATQSLERLLLQTNGASWEQFVGKFDQAKGMMNSAVEQFGKTESKLKQTASTPDMRDKWTKLTSKSGEDAANAFIALKQSAAAQRSPESDVLQSGETDMASYQEVVQRYTQYYQDLTKALADTAQDVKSGNDANTLRVNVKDILKQLNAVVDRAKQESLQLKGAPAKTDKEGYQKWLADWRRELGDTRDPDNIPTGPVTVDDEGRVWVNTAETDNMIASLKHMYRLSDIMPETFMNTAEYQAWQSGRDTQRSNIQSNVQTLLTKFQNRQSNFDNLSKLITNTISQMFEARKQFLQ
ncbi:hypothetical protein WJ69_34280 [Burkholderia ubonensis]|uniref:IpaD/SipD/SspD family type III secretion system needle tip protein n=1 Tax=Burkholderia ubonensis TaxID=101571 RepID=UPI000751DCF4|nr:IpaD/SipD/SspD family type III secretion system needle tip protein [Burkholderia ubonensis]KVN98525.1 hypothetical protein WJ69_34280 [Burkholderia ubonensis]